MFKLNENEVAYRFGDSGPKYLMRGPRSNFAMVRLKAREDFKAHYHNIMEENFFVLEGTVDIVVNGTMHTLTTGDLIHVEPKEVHYLINNSDQPVKLVATLAPFAEVDKVEVEDYQY